MSSIILIIPNPISFEQACGIMVLVAQIVGGSFAIIDTEKKITYQYDYNNGLGTQCSTRLVSGGEVIADAYGSHISPISSFNLSVHRLEEYGPDIRIVQLTDIIANGIIAELKKC